ncbi:class I SAM-dependent methyltransferase [Bacillus marinisedimentorum]|uniref:class I SAM-dependent methyltransferase n=1 Tax=Bacillus marinisedimentorum TaxID=1821260 RepID=UPI00087245F6|nr:class I SAM-dependent methyltransferase [Bacillus marinisedimentorum]
MTMYPYLECLAALGVADAHPGGFPLTKKLIEQHTDYFAGKEILDAGCGTGRTAAYLADHSDTLVTAVDAHPLMIKKAKARFPEEKPNMTILQADITALPFTNASFDAILSESVVIFTDIRASLDEFTRVLKPGGKLILNEMTSEAALPEQLMEQMTSLYGISSIPTADAWIKHLESLDFKNVKASKPDFPVSGTPREFMPEFDLSADHFKTLKEHEKMLDSTKQLIGWNIYIGTKR